MAHEAQRTETAADVASKVDDEPLDPLVFEIANDVIQAFCEIQADGTRERRHADITSLLGQNPIGEAARLNHRRPVFRGAVWDTNRDFPLASIKATKFNAVVTTNVKVC